MSDPHDRGAMVELPVTGAELALFLSAAFMLDHWRFELTESRAMIVTADRDLCTETNEEVSRESKRILHAAGAFEQTTLWTRGFIAKRAAVEGRLRLTWRQLETLILALRVCYVEFSNNWTDFYIASPGNVDWYDVDADDLASLARRLERIVHPGPTAAY